VTSTQLDLLSAVEPYHEPVAVSGRQHAFALVALLEAGSRGLCGEEVFVLGKGLYRAAHVATTRLGEMADNRTKFPVPLTYRSERRDRATASGVLAYRFFLTDSGRVEAERVRDQR